MVACTQTLLFLFLFSTTSERTHCFLKVVVSLRLVMKDFKLSSWRIFFLMSEIMKSGAECVKQWHPNFSDPRMLERIFKAFVQWLEMLLVIWRRPGEMLDLTTRFLTSKIFFTTFPPKVSTFISGRWRSLQPVQTQLDSSTVFTRLNALYGSKIVSKRCPRKNAAPNPLPRLFEDYKTKVGTTP